jgi:ribosome-binding protein aMBF1 (putative translation factor)
MTRRAPAATRPRSRRGGDPSEERAELLGRFARQLKQYRVAAGSRQEALAAKVGRGRLYLVKLEGAQREPSLVTLARLARMLQVPIGALLE